MNRRDATEPLLDWANFAGPSRNIEWKPDDQELICTALNFCADEGDQDEDAGQQIVERLLAAWQLTAISDGRPCTMEAFVAALLAEGLDAPVIKGAISAWIKGDWQAALLPLSDDARTRLTGKGGAA
ncbi:hypothetical protein V6767_12895 [Martelella sp. FLE1502]